jgi:type III secretory pathway component EscU
MKMMMMPFKMALRFVTVMLLFAQLMVMLFLAAAFVLFTVVPAVMFALFFVKKKMHMGKMGRHGRMHMHGPTPRRFKP